jgi:hypothetical protein
VKRIKKPSIGSCSPEWEELRARWIFGLSRVLEVMRFACYGVLDSEL